MRRPRLVMAVTRKELVGTWRDRRVVRALGLIVVLYLAALGLARWQHDQAWAEYEFAREQVRHSWLEQGERNPHDAGHWGTYVFRAPSPLSIIDRGAVDYMGSWIHLETHRQNDARHKPAREATGFFRLGGFTPGQVAILLLPLALLIMTHAAVTSEIEGGTAALLRATGVQPDTLYLGKLLAAFLFAAAWAVPLLLLTGVVVATAPGAAADTAAATTAALLLLLLYAALFVVLGVGISAVATSSSQALAVSFCAWALLCLVVPRVAASVAQAAAPTPTAFEFRQVLEDERENRWGIAYRGRGTFREVYRQAEEAAMREAGVTDPDALLIDPFGLAIEETEQEGQRAYEASFRRVLESFQEQARLQQAFALLSPQVALAGALSGLAGGDIASHLRFADAAELYRRQLMNRLNLDIAYNARRQAALEVSTTGFARDYVRDNEFWATFDEFREPPPEPAAVSNAALPAAGLLSAWLFGLLLFSRRALLRRWAS